MPERDITVRFATDADAESIVEIYNHYVNETVVTFEEEADKSSTTEFVRGLPFCAVPRVRRR